MATGVQIEGGGFQELPSIPQSWIGWQPGSEGQWIQEGGDGGGMRWAGGASDAGYNFVAGPEANSFYESPFWRNTNNYEWAFDPQTGAPSVRVKSGDKTGTTVRYVPDASGNWVPDYGTAQNTRWDTNDLKQGWWALMPIAAGLGGYALAELAGVAAAAETGGAGAAGTAAGMQAFSPEVMAGIYGGAGEPLVGGLTLTEAATAGAIPGVGAAIDPYMAGAAAASGAAPAASTVTTTAGTSAGIGSIAEKIGEWALKNPQAVLTGIGMIGSLVEGKNNESGSGGSGSGGGGWNGPIPSYQAVQTRAAAPAGYRPGFSPEHVYINTDYTLGTPSASANQVGAPGTTSRAATAGIPKIDIPPLPPVAFSDGGIVAIDPASAFTPNPWARPTGVATLPAYPRFAGAAGGPAYVPQDPAGGLAALFQILNTPGTAPPRPRPVMTPEQDNARWSQAGFNPTRSNNMTPSGGTATRSGATRAGFGGYGTPKFATGGYVQGPGTETSDSIPAMIEGDQPAKLSNNEFVLPAWFVKYMGNGSADAGAQRLYAMMEQAKQQARG